MPRFTSVDGVALHYEITGVGEPVVLLHGFAADARINWEQPGVTAALVAEGRTVISLDARGHGQSDKPHDVAAYMGTIMSRDVSALIDHLGYQEVDIVGYSMGALTALRLAVDELRVRSAVLGGIGAAVLSANRDAHRDVIAAALEASDPKSVEHPAARGFRRFADSTGADRLALAAIQRSDSRSEIGDVSAIRIPTLVLTSAEDELVGSPQGLADAIPGSRAVVLSGSHLAAVGDPRFVPAIVGFLREAATG